MKVAAVVLGAWAGYCLGMTINTSVLYLAEQDVLFWCVNLGLALICGMLAILFFDPGVIVATSFVGAYLMMRGIGLMAGGFPNEYLLLSQIKSRTMKKIDPVFYWYLAGLLIMTILGVCVQLRMNRGR